LCRDSLPGAIIAPFGEVIAAHFGDAMLGILYRSGKSNRIITTVVSQAFLLNSIPKLKMETPTN
jgi:hypothetical protein